MYNNAYPYIIRIGHRNDIRTGHRNAKWIGHSPANWIGYSLQHCVGEIVAEGDAGDDVGHVGEGKRMGLQKVFHIFLGSSAKVQRIFEISKKIGEKNTKYKIQNYKKREMGLEL